MAKLIVSSGQNIFNRNYHGSTLYCRNGITLFRQKHITKHIPQNKTVFVSDLLKTSVVDYESLSPAKKQTFDDFVVLNPEYKSGINVMAKINIANNYANKSDFRLINFIDSLATPPLTPSIVISSVNKSQGTVSLTWGPAVEIGTKIDFYYKSSNWAPIPKSTYFGYLIRSAACFYAGTFRVPNLAYSQYINLKATYTSPEKIKSPFSTIVYHLV